jgi:Meckel syndrome type 1 protein
MLPIPFLSAGSALPALPGTTPVAAPGAIDFAALLPAGVATLIPRQGDAEPGKQLPAIAAEQDDPAGGAAVAWIVPPLWDMMRAPVVAAPRGAAPVGAEAPTIDTSSTDPLASSAMGDSTIAHTSSGAVAPLLDSTSYQATPIAPGVAPVADEAAPAMPLPRSDGRRSVTPGSLTKPGLRQTAQVTADVAPAIANPTASIHAGESPAPLATRPLLDPGLRGSGTEHGAVAAPSLDASPHARIGKNPSRAAFTTAPDTAIHPGPGRDSAAAASMPASSLDQRAEPSLVALTTASATTVQPGVAGAPVAPVRTPALNLGQETELPLAAPPTATSPSGEGRNAATTGSVLASTGDQGRAPSLIPLTSAAGSTEGLTLVTPVSAPAPSLEQGMEASPTLTPSATSTIYPGRGWNPVASIAMPAPGPAHGTKSSVIPLTTATTPAVHPDDGGSPLAPLTTASAPAIHPGESGGPIAPVLTPARGLAQGMEPSLAPLVTATAPAIHPGKSGSPDASISMPAPSFDQETEPSLGTPTTHTTPVISSGEGRGSATTNPMLETTSRRVGVEGDGAATAPTGQPEAFPRATGAKDQSTPNVAQFALAQQQPAAPPQPTRIAPAAQVFAAAIHQAVRDERRSDTPDSMIAAIAPATTDLAAHAVTAADGPRHPALDMARDTWPAKMIERIEMIRDAMNAVDTSIRLVPDKLGAIDVSLKQDGGTVQVHFVAQQPETRQLLADAQPKLAELAEAKGLKLSAQLGDGGGQQQQQRAPNAPQQTITTRPSRAASNDDAAALADERIA